MVIIVCGLPGSGKSYFASRLAAVLDAEYVSSDALRFRMFPHPSYTTEEKRQVYHAMLEAMLNAITRQRTIVLDATFHKASYREPFEEKTKTLGIPLVYIEVVAPDDLIRTRLSKKRPDSEADYGVYLTLKEKTEPLLQDHLVLESSDSNVEEMLLRALQHLHSHYERKTD